MANYERVGGGSFGVYKKKEGAWGWVVLIVFLVIVIAAASNDGAGSAAGTPASTSPLGR